MLELREILVERELAHFEPERLEVVHVRGQRLSLANPDTEAILTDGGALADLGRSDGLVFSAEANLNAVGSPAAARWAWRYWNDLPGLAPPSSAGDYQPFNGLTSTWVKSYSNCSGIICLPPTTTDITGKDPLPAVRQYVRRTILHEHNLHLVPDCPSKLVGHKHLPIPTTGCLDCDGDGTAPSGLVPTAPPPPPIAQVQPRTILEIDPINGTLRMEAPWYEPRIVTGTFDPTLLGLLFDSNNVLVTASDAPQWWNGAIIGSIVDKRTTQALVDISAAGATFAPRGSTGQQCNPITQTCLDPVVAVSGRFQELVVFGEQPGAVRVRHIDTGLEELRTIVGSGAIGDPVAATYRAEDDAYYVLTHGKKKREIDLLRLERDMTLHSVARYFNFSRATGFALTTGWDGTLVISAWSDARHLVAVLSIVDAVSPPKLLRVVRGKDALGLEAHSEYRGIYVARTVAGVEQPPEWLPPPKIGEPFDDGDFDRDDGR